jgi:hypothetical protein
MRRNIQKLLSFLISVSLLLACKINSHEFITATNQDLIASVELKSSETKVIGGTKNLFVYGELNAEGAKKDVSAVNLNCFQLRVGTYLSEDISVDSIASVLRERYESKDGKVMVRVYWVFEDLKESDLSNLNKELILSDSQECVFY